MQHEVERTFVLHCFDPDLKRAIADYLTARGIYETAVCFSPAGGCLDLARPVLDSDIAYVMKQLNLAITELAATDVILMNQTDCRAYQKICGDFPSEQEEREILIGDMKKAARLIRGVYPELGIEFVLIKVTRGTPGDQPAVTFETVPAQIEPRVFAQSAI